MQMPRFCIQESRGLKLGYRYSVSGNPDFLYFARGARTETGYLRSFFLATRSLARGLFFSISELFFGKKRVPKNLFLLHVIWGLTFEVQTGGNFPPVGILVASVYFSLYLCGFI